MHASRSAPVTFEQLGTLEEYESWLFHQMSDDKSDDSDDAYADDDEPAAEDSS